MSFKTIDVWLTPFFARWAEKAWTDEESRRFNEFIILHPNAGDIIPGTGGARKVRWSAGGKGKRGGSRVIYYYSNGQSLIYLLMGYRTSDQTDLSPQDRKRLKDALNQIKNTERN